MRLSKMQKELLIDCHRAAEGTMQAGTDWQRTARALERRKLVKCSGQYTSIFLATITDLGRAVADSLTTDSSKEEK